MTHLLEQAGKSFIVAFGSALVVFLPGIYAAPDLSNLKGLALGALIASVIAGLRAIQVFVPQLSWDNLITNAAVARIVDSFTRAFVGTFLTLITNGLGVIHVFTLSTGKELIVAALVAAVAAGFRAIQGWLTIGEYPQPAKGMKV